MRISGQERQRRCPHAKVLGSSVWDLSEVCTRTFRRPEIATMCNYRCSWEDCCSRRVCRQDVEVVKHPKHCKNGIPYSQFCAFAVFPPIEEDDFLHKCQEMSIFFESRGYPSDLPQNVREKVSSVTRQEALEKRVRENEGRIPLVLTNHPLTWTIRERFTCTSENVVYCISCPAIHRRDRSNSTRTIRRTSFGAFRKTLVVSRSQSTLTPPVIVYQTLL